MALTAGTLSALVTGSTTATVASTAASGGTGPYTNQWYRSTTNNFTPGAGNIVSGATALQLVDSGLIPNTPYYYKMIYTDTGNGNAVITSAQLALATVPQTMAINSFAQQLIGGMVDLRYAPNTVSVQVDVSQATPLYAGQAVKIVDSVDGVPKVVGCAANSDEVLGFINYDAKTVQFLAGYPAEISMSLNAIYLFATAPIARGQRVTLDLSSPAAVGPLVASSGACIVGWAYDKAVTAGSLIRVMLQTPSYARA